MPLYTLLFSEENQGEAKRVEVSAPDASKALLAAGDEAAERDIELWLGDRKLCSIMQSHGVWQIDR